MSNISEQQKTFSPIPNYLPEHSSCMDCTDVTEPMLTATTEGEGEKELEINGLEKVGVQQALTETLKIMQEQLAWPTDNPVSNLTQPPDRAIDDSVQVRELPNSQVLNLENQVNESLDTVAQPGKLVQPETA